jgi:Pectate lyase superfamily protein
MRKLFFPYAFFLLIFLSACSIEAQGVIPCAADGSTDVTACLQNSLNTIGSSKARQAFLSAGVYLVSNTIVIPDRTQISGVGRGDTGINTVIRAAANFPPNAPLVQMGANNGLSFGVQVTNMTLDGSSVAGACLYNVSAEELSWGRTLMMTNCSVGLYTAGSGAQNAGPFEDLEIYPGSGPSVTSASRCAEVIGVPAFRGIKGLTCNGGTAYSSEPAAALVVVGSSGIFSDVHAEHFSTAISLGDDSIGSIDGVTVIDTAFGPDVQTGVRITGGSQNVTLMSIQCFGCTNLVDDRRTNHTFPDTSVAFYMIGDGGSGATVISSKFGLDQQIYGNQRVLGNLVIGPSNPGHGSTLSIWDATPNTGVTSIVEQAGANQFNSGVDLQQWRDQWNNSRTRVDSLGALHTSFMQVFSWQQRPTCNWDNRGTFSFIPEGSGQQDHIQVCMKKPDDSYDYVTIF